MINLGEYKVIWANTYFKKLRGLFFYDKNTLVIFENCNDIHTFLFKNKIDVAFFDKNWALLKSINKIKPWKRIKCKNAFYVLERYSQNKEWFD